MSWHVQLNFFENTHTVPLGNFHSPAGNLVDKLISLKGLVIKQSPRQVRQVKKAYRCKSCGGVFLNEGAFEDYYKIKQPQKCPMNDGCRRGAFTEVPLTGAGMTVLTKVTQDIIIRDVTRAKENGTGVPSMAIVLEDDLVGTCRLGDTVLVTGIMKLRWKPLVIGRKPCVKQAIKAVGILVPKDVGADTDCANLLPKFRKFWRVNRGNPLMARDLIVSSLCPRLYQMYLAKLAVILTLIGGVSIKDASGAWMRGTLHLLLVGDPGTGKSELLKVAADLAPRSVFTTGINSTNAGLTCQARKEGNEWQLDAGALPLADGGVCCIDEFDALKETDQDALREAMEQQTVSVAKAGITTTLRCRCSVVAALNPNEKTENINLSGLNSPLLSRFDLLLVMKKAHTNDEKAWLRRIMLHVVERHTRRDSNDNDRSDGFWNNNELKAYVAVVQDFKPTVEADSQEILRKYYQLHRNNLLRDAGKTTARMMDSLIRLTQAHAKLMFRERATVVDAIVAIQLVDCGMQEPIFFDSIDIVRTEFPTNPAKSFAKLAEIILRELDSMRLFSHVCEEIGINPDTANFTKIIDKTRADVATKKPKVEVIDDIEEIEPVEPTVSSKPVQEEEEVRRFSVAQIRQFAFDEDLLDK